MELYSIPYFGAGGENASQRRRVQKKNFFCPAPRFRTLICSLRSL